MVTPRRIQRSLMRSRSSASATASWARSLTPAASMGSATTSDVHRVAGVVEHADHVGQVVLALGVGRAEPAQRRGQQAAAEAVDRGVDLGDGPLLVGGVGLLDHPGHQRRPGPGRSGRSRWVGRPRRSAGWPRRRGAGGGGPARPGWAVAAAGCRRAGPRRRRPRRSSSGSPVRPTAAASPVPRWVGCSTNSMSRLVGACSTRVLVTHSPRWPTTTTTRSTSSSASASSTWRTIGRPHSWCSGLGRFERIRVPSPAASTTAESGRGGSWAHSSVPAPRALVGGARVGRPGCGAPRWRGL